VNIALWIFRLLLSLHTVTGAVWKFSNSEQTVPSLKALPHGVWLGLSVLELLVAVGLVVPARNVQLAKVAPIAALALVAEMLLFCALHLGSGQSEHGEMVYWLVVALMAGLVAAGLKTFGPKLAV
jgi:heme/copper-type cytochrome/quinol oxidase subunit 4